MYGDDDTPSVVISRAPLPSGCETHTLLSRMNTRLAADAEAVPTLVALRAATTAARILWRMSGAAALVGRDDHSEAGAALDDSADHLRADRRLECAGLRGVDAVLLEEGLKTGRLEAGDGADLFVAVVAEGVDDAPSNLGVFPWTQRRPFAVAHHA